MTEPLNILIIEDSNTDFLLVERHLKQKGLAASCSRVDTLAGVKEAIDRESWDLVLSDYNVPQLGFHESLDLILTALPDLPVIMVTGTVGEEKAVELLKLGVCDFVLKGTLTRLVPAIERSLREASAHKGKRAAEAELRESNERFRMIYEHSIDAILLARPDGSVLAANPEACRVFGMSEAEIRRVGRAGLVDEDDVRFSALLAGRKSTGQYRGEITMKRGDGSRFPAETSSAVFTAGDGIQKTSMIIRDVTERKKLEEQFHQAQKMEAVGQLAGGVAHDFNNVLSAIFGYSHMILNQTKENELVKNYIYEIMKASERAAVLTRSLLTFSRKQDVTLAIIDISAIIKENEVFLRRLIREDIELKIICSGESIFVLADRGQIEQVLMNLVTNASDAMPNGGILSIKTHAVTLEQELNETHGCSKAGAYFSFSVSDSGVGMDKETQLRIFDPFFTTKEQGKGTGLGLSMAYGIIKKHDGFINVQSEPGSGTTFNIYLPVVTSATLAVKKETRVVPSLRGGTETILVVEDDAVLLRLSTKVLGYYGYSVIGAVDGQDAVDKFVEFGDSIDLVILDVIMPNKNGTVACQEMRLVRPDLNVVFVSGYSREILAELYEYDGITAFISKPVSTDELLDKIREMLDNKFAPVNLRRNDILMKL